MKIAVLKEAAGETRCAAIPEMVKKFAALVADLRHPSVDGVPAVGHEAGLGPAADSLRS